MSSLRLRPAAGALLLLGVLATTSTAQSLASLPDNPGLRVDAASPRYPLVRPTEGDGPPRFGGSGQHPGILSGAAHAELRPSAPDLRAFPIRYGTGVRRVLLMGLTGAAAGAVAGMAMEVVDPDGEIADVWPVLLAVPGFFGGIVYSLVR